MTRTEFPCQWLWESGRVWFPMNWIRYRFFSIYRCHQNSSTWWMVYHPSTWNRLQVWEPKSCASNIGIDIAMTEVVGNYSFTRRTAHFRSESLVAMAWVFLALGNGWPWGPYLKGESGVSSYNLGWVSSRQPQCASVAILSHVSHYWRDSYYLIGNIQEPLSTAMPSLEGKAGNLVPDLSPERLS